MKKRRKPLILLGFPAEFLAFPRWFEHPTYRLGGGRSIQLSYGNIFKIYSILVLNLLNVNRLCPKGGRYNIFLGGECSMQLSYGGKWRYFIILRNIRNFFTVFCFLWFRILPNFIFVKKVRIFTVSIFQTFSKGDRSNYHLGGGRSIRLSYSDIY